MTNYQVWAKDKYGHHEVLAILSTKGISEDEWGTSEAALAAARRFVHDKNRNNSLTFDEQKKDISCVAVESDTGVYAGNLIRGKHKQLVKQGEETVEADFVESQPVKFYCGQTPDDTPWYWADPRNRLIQSLAEVVSQEKTILFVHKQEG